MSINYVTDIAKEFNRNKSKYSDLWYVHTYQHAVDSPPETCVHMAVRMAASKIPNRYDILWIDSFGNDDSFTPKLLKDVSRETGLRLDDFTIDNSGKSDLGAAIADIDAETLKAFYVFNISWVESGHKMAEGVREVMNAHNMHLDSSKPSLHLV